MTRVMKRGFSLRLSPIPVIALLAGVGVSLVVVMLISRTPQTEAGPIPPRPHDPFVLASPSPTDGLDCNSGDGVLMGHGSYDPEDPAGKFSTPEASLIDFAGRMYPKLEARTARRATQTTTSASLVIEQGGRVVVQAQISKHERGWALDSFSGCGSVLAASR